MNGLPLANNDDTAHTSLSAKIAASIYGHGMVNHIQCTQYICAMQCSDWAVPRYGVMISSIERYDGEHLIDEQSHEPYMPYIVMLMHDQLYHIISYHRTNMMICGECAHELYEYQDHCYQERHRYALQSDQHSAAYLCMMHHRYIFIYIAHTKDIICNR